MSEREKLVNEINTRFDNITEGLEKILRFVESGNYTSEEIANELRELLEVLV